MTSAEAKLLRALEKRRLGTTRFTQFSSDRYVIELLREDRMLAIGVTDVQKTYEKSYWRSSLQRDGYWVLEFDVGQVENDLDGVLNKIVRNWDYKDEA